MRRDFLLYLFGLFFLSFSISGCTRYYNPVGTNYNKANRYYNPSPQTKTTSGLNNSNRFSTTSNNNGYRDDTNNYDKGVNNTNYRGKKRYYNNNDDKGINNTNYRGKNRDKNRDYYNWYQGKDKNIYSNREKIKRKKRRKNRDRRDRGRRKNSRYNIGDNTDTYSRLAVVEQNFTNDPRYEYHMDKRRFFYRPRAKVPYYYKDGIYYYGGAYSNGAYEYRGTTFTDGEYHGYK